MLVVACQEAGLNESAYILSCLGSPLPQEDNPGLTFHTLEWLAGTPDMPRYLAEIEAWVYITR